MAILQGIDLSLGLDVQPGMVMAAQYQLADLRRLFICIVVFTYGSSLRNMAPQPGSGMIGLPVMPWRKKDALTM